MYLATHTLLIIPIEYLGRQPPILADLEALCNTIDTLDFILSQFPIVQLKVSLNPLRCDTLGNDAPILLHTPHEQHLLRCLALGLCDLEQGLVGIEGRIGGAEARVARAMDALGFVVLDQLGRRVAWMKLDLVGGGHGLEKIRIPV